MLQGLLLPDSTGECFPVPYDSLATNDVWAFGVMQFGSAAAAQPTVAHGFYGNFEVPQNYSGTASIIVVWSSTITSGDVEWDLTYRAVAIGESFDQTGSQQALNQNDTAPGSVNLYQEASLSPTSGNFTVGDRVEYFLSRDGTDAGDTIAGPVYMLDLIFQYDD
jgi:hypothetical protein